MSKSFPAWYYRAKIVNGSFFFFFVHFVFPSIWKLLIGLCVVKIHFIEKDFKR